MDIINNKKMSQKGSSILIALIIIVLAILVLSHYGLTFGSVWNTIKNFFGIH